MDYDRRLRHRAIATRHEKLTMLYAAFPRPIDHQQAMESTTYSALKQGLTHYER